MAKRTSPGSISWNPGDEAGFRAWVGEISAGFQACGMVKTADTGQLDPATVLKPTTAGMIAGYEIFRFSDTLQATKPIFFKIEYGQGPTGWAAQQQIFVTFGTGSNGAGTLTGPLSGRISFISPGSSTANTHVGPAYWSGDGSGVAAVLGDRTDRPWMVLNFERTRNPTDGAAVGEGVLCYSWCGDAYNALNTHNWVMYPTNGRTNPGGWYRGPIPCTTIVPQGLSTGIVGTDVYMWPQYASYPSLYPHMNIYTYAAQDVARGTEFPMTALGVSRTYKAFDFTDYSIVPGIVGATPRSAYAIRWE